MSSRHPETAIETLLRREKSGAPSFLLWSIAGLCIFFSLLHIFWTGFSPVDPYMQRFLCLTLLLIIGILLRPLGRKTWHSSINMWFIIDSFLILLLAGCLIYVVYDFDSFVMRTSNLKPPDVAMCTIYVLILLEVTRRHVGWALVIIPVFFLLQNSFGPYFPGFLRGPAISWAYEMQIVMMQDVGIFGIPIKVVTELIMPFMFLVALLTESRAHVLFLNLAMSVAGRYSGGPAKIAVIGSTLMGTMTGSAIANVVGTGPFTIPLMKQNGFRPSVAGAVEACASTGGQLVPPVMGTVAFLMAEFIGVEYYRICLMALIPAFIYYFSIFSAVHFEAKKLKLATLKVTDIPSFKSAIVNSWSLLTAVALLFFLLMLGWGAGTAALWASIACLLLTMIRKETRISAFGLLVCLEKAVRMILGAAIAIGAVGIVIGAFYTSGFGTYFAMLVERIAGGSAIIALIMCAIACLILGMGLPTAPVYVLGYMLILKGLTALGINEIAAHFFIIWYGVLAPLTPPVGLAFLTAAGIAQCNPLQCGLQSTRLGFVAFLLPFAIALSPALVLQGSPMEIILHAIAAMAAAFSIAGGLSGYISGPGNIGWLMRAILVTLGIICMAPSIYIAPAAAAIIVLLLVIPVVIKGVRQRAQPASVT